MNESPPRLHAAKRLLRYLIALCLVSMSGVLAYADERPLKTAATSSSPAPQAKPIFIGLDADMSKGSAQGGESIRRGLEIAIAIAEINAQGGVLNRPLKLLVKDHRGIPARGIDNIADFAAQHDLVAVVGGIHTPVALAELPGIHSNQLIYLDPWAAGTPIVDNGYEPNYVFRVSVRDEFAGGFLVDAAYQQGHQRLGLLLWRTGWGRSNEAAIKAALADRNAAPVAVQWFNTGQKDVAKELTALRDAGAEVIVLVANAPDGLVAVRAMAAMDSAHRLPIISHWGITGGDFYVRAQEFLSRVELSFLQTYSFIAPRQKNKNAAVLAAYCKHFQGCSAGDVISPVGTAHAYDLIHLLRMAIDAAGTIDRPTVRRALETLERYEGLVRVYDPAFTPERHDALDASDFRLSHYGSSGQIIPVTEQ